MLTRSECNDGHIFSFSARFVDNLSQARHKEAKKKKNRLYRAKIQTNIYPSRTVSVINFAVSLINETHLFFLWVSIFKLCKIFENVRLQTEIQVIHSFYVTTVTTAMYMHIILGKIRMNDVDDHMSRNH